MPQILDITIGDINYVSYPAPCSSEPGVDLADSEEGTESTASSSAITMFNVVVARVRGDNAESPIDSLPAGIDPLSVLLGLTAQSPTVSGQVVKRF